MCYAVEFAFLYSPHFHSLQSSVCVCVTCVLQDMGILGFWGLNSDYQIFVASAFHIEPPKSTTFDLRMRNCWVRSLEGHGAAFSTSPLVTSRVGRRTLLCGLLWHTAAGLDPLDVSGIMPTSPAKTTKTSSDFTSHGKKTLLNGVRGVTKIARGSACNPYKLFYGLVEFAVLWLAFCSWRNTSSPFELVYLYEVCVEKGHTRRPEAGIRWPPLSFLPRSSEVRFITGLEGGVCPWGWRSADLRHPVFICPQLLIYHIWLWCRCWKLSSALQRLVLLTAKPPITSPALAHPHSPTPHYIPLPLPYNPPPQGQF